MEIMEGIINFYDQLVNLMPKNFEFAPSLFLITIIIAGYGLFILFFYRFLSSRDVIKLKLSPYNTAKHAGLKKFIAIVFYLIEFIIITPIAIFFWFAIISIFLIVLTKEIEVGTVIFICAGLISAIRITAYFSEDLSKDLAKMIPFTLLGVVILNHNFIDIITIIERISKIPLFFNNIIYYLIFIVLLEVILRLFYLILGNKVEKNSK
jgi:hypothetical protein